MADKGEIRIYGVPFEVSRPYKEGHTINAAEAHALNQTRAENISNLVRKPIAELRTEDGSMTDEAIAKATEMVAERDAGYEFAMPGTGGGGRSAMTSLEKEARAIARDYVKQAIAQQGKALKDVDKEAFDAKVAEVAAHEKVQKLAQKRLDERAKLTSGMDIEI